MYLDMLIPAAGGFILGITLVLFILFMKGY